MESVSFTRLEIPNSKQYAKKSGDAERQSVLLQNQSLHNKASRFDACRNQHTYDDGGSFQIPVKINQKKKITICFPVRFEIPHKSEKWGKISFSILEFDTEEYHISHIA